MNIAFRTYRHPADYGDIDEFLVRHYLPGNADGNWIEPAWEYMNFHPCLDSPVLAKIGIWEAEGQIVAVAHNESQAGEAFFQFHPDYRALRTEMLAYAEQNLAGVDDAGRETLRVYVNDNDPEFQALVQRRGYRREPDHDRPMCKFEIPSPFPTIHLADGFHLTSLAEEPDWAKVHRVLWRGFDNGEDPPVSAAEFDSRRRMFDTPTARRDLKIAVRAPNGEFAAFCGMFYEPVNKFAYVEPVATDPAYRRRGLGKAAVLEGIRRCGRLGAEAAYVGNDLPIYRAIGFRPVFITECWLKFLDG